MLGIFAATILGLYLLGNQGGNDSTGNYLATYAFWTVIAATATRFFR